MQEIKINWNKLEEFTMLPSEVVKLNKVNGKVFSMQGKVLYSFMAKYYNDKGVFDLALETVATRFGVSKKTASGWLKDLTEKYNLLEILTQGKGKKTTYKVLPLYMEDTTTPSKEEYKNDNSRNTEFNGEIYGKNKAKADNYKELRKPLKMGTEEYKKLTNTIKEINNCGGSVIWKATVDFKAPKEAVEDSKPIIKAIVPEKIECAVCGCEVVDGWCNNSDCIDGGSFDF